MATFFEQFRDFLAPRFQLERELGSGGEARVYLASDTALRCSVAVKVLPPEKASAAAAERFRKEARILAELRGHPNIVPIFDVGRDDDPFTYYIMEYLPGDSLADRLEKAGPLPQDDVVRLGRDLLAALRVAHAHGVIHRDIKPGNVFWVEDRGVLTDFGVAKSLSHQTATTGTGVRRGTPAYWAPEQLAGHDVVPQTDLYTVGMVLYEALTGVRWETGALPERADWARVPAKMRPALSRALALSPEQRWPDAEAFQQALKQPAIPGAMRRIALVAVGVGVLFGAFFFCCRPIRPSVDMRIDRLTIVGTQLMPGLGDSIAARLTDLLTGFPDFSVAGPAFQGHARTIVRGSVTVDSGGRLRIQMQMPGHPMVSLPARIERWRTAADMFADSMLLQLFGSSPLDSDLPVGVLPQDPNGLRSFLVAEKAFARAGWDSAYDGYQDASAAGRSCALCFWRHAEVARFLAKPPDTADATEYRARVNEFPPNYQTLIRAELVPLDARLDSLYALTQRAPQFLFAPFRWGDELLHRGPLVGRPRLGASVGFIKATEIRRDFAPAWEHLAWLRIAEGNRREALAALDTLAALPAPATAGTGLRELLKVAYVWRFLPAAAAQSQASLVVDAAAVGGTVHLDAGARYLNHFGAPQGAVWLGAQLEAGDYHKMSAMLAQAFGNLSAGRPGQAHQVLARAMTQFGDPSHELLDREIEAVLLMFDRDSAEATPLWGDVAAGLRELAQQLPASLRPRAAWMQGLLARRFGAPPPALTPDVPAPLVLLLHAYDAASHGLLSDALAQTEPLRLLPAENVGDPFLRTILHLLRANWQVRVGQPKLADRELMWYENSDQVGLPSGDPQPMEIDWAFGTLARWWRVRLAVSEETRCQMAREVARLWTGAEPSYAARADKARAIAHSCPEPVP